MPRIANSLRAARWVFVVFVVLSWTVLTPSSGQAATASAEQIHTYSIDLQLTKDDVLHVREIIGYDFGTDQRHGIDRTIPVESHYGKHQLREFPLDRIAVSSPTHAPAQEQTLTGSSVRIRIGDPANATITGRQTYVLSYDVKAVVNSFSDHQELYWNAVGDQWAVPIDAVSVTVEGPAAIQKVACYQGAQRSTGRCPGAITAAGTASFSSGALSPGHGMTVVASFPAGTFPNAAPILRHRWTWGEAFSLTPATIAGALGVFAVLGGWTIFQVLRRGRDERYLGITPGLQPNFGQQQPIGRVSWWRRDPVAVQFTPPAGVRPGELGALIDQRAETLHVTATIIDLAVRGYLTIDELVKPRKKQSGDWKLTRLRGKSTKDLRGYESKVYGSLFRSGRVVRFSQLRKTFGEDSEEIKAMLEDDVTDQGWFRALPTKVRAKWFGFGLFTVAIGLALTSVLALVSHYGLLGLAVIAAGVLLLVLSRQMPARSAAGTAVLTQTRGFRLYLEKAEASQIRFEEGEDVFSRYLPYAIIFGVADRWAAVFAELAASGAVQPVPTWYAGSSTWNYALFDLVLFNDRLDDFSSTSPDSTFSSYDPVPSSPGSSGLSGLGGGGYSDGGSGGGGGGSW